jgi:hypothetical protein
MRADVFTTFKRTMRRTYDWTTPGVGSRYMLIKEFSAVGAFGDIIHVGPNITSVEAKIGMNVVYEADFMLHYTNGNFIVDAGYGLRGHSKEEHKEWVGEITGSKYGFWSIAANANDNNVATDALVNGFQATETAHTAALSLTQANLS